jgi:hypothetical protein
MYRKGDYDVRFLVLVTAAAAAMPAFADTLVLRPGAEGKDAMINFMEPSTNFGNYAYLMVNFGPATEVRGLVEFSGLSAVSGATINAASFDLWIDRANSTNYNFGVYRLTESWEEASVTWANQPSHHATAYDTKLISGAVGGPYTWDVKTLVQEWANGTHTNCGLMLKRVNMNYPSNWPYFCSSDHSTASYHPRLTVDYVLPAVLPTSMGEIKALFR